MSTVEILLKTPQQTGSLAVIDEYRIRTHSATIDSLLGPRAAQLKRQVTISGAAPAALTFLLDRIRTNTRSPALHIKMHDQPLPKACAIFEAAEILGLRPAQPHIESHILYYVSHNVLTPSEVLVTHKCFVGRQGTSEVWRALVHQVGWCIAYGDYDAQGASALQAAATRYPELVAAVDRKVYEELLPRREAEVARAMGWEGQWWEWKAAQGERMGE